MRALIVVLLVACGGKPPPAKPPVCEDPKPGEAMTEEMCKCRKGIVQLSNGAAVELHCEPGDDDIGAVRIGDRDGWCCRPRS